jgi:Fur family ferric uptake transcriptional regulator/Fur family peroxide stress response transcriptional regulator
MGSREISSLLSTASRVEEAFERLGVPLTDQRRMVWEHFATCGRATTISEVSAALAQAGVGQATVYRTVALLCNMGLLVQVQTTLPHACYTAVGVGHTHPLVCRECRRVIDFRGDGDLTLLEHHLKAMTGFAIYGHHLEVYGVCPRCARNASGQADIISPGATSDQEP